MSVHFQDQEIVDPNKESKTTSKLGDNQDLPKTEVDQSQSDFEEHHDIFISHASRSGDKPEQKTPLVGEERFVRLLAASLRDKFNYDVYLDLDRPSFPGDDELQRAYKHSSFGVFVCSPRFNFRYMHRPGGFQIKEEVKHFRSVVNDTGQKCIIPILFGIEKIEFTMESPFESLDYHIKNYYDDLVKNNFDTNFIIENICSEIDTRIKGIRGSTLT